MTLRWSAEANNVCSRFFILHTITIWLSQLRSRNNIKLNNKVEITSCVNHVLKRCFDEIIAVCRLVKQHNVKTNENVTQDLVLELMSPLLEAKLVKQQQQSILERMLAADSCSVQVTFKE